MMCFSATVLNSYVHTHTHTHTHMHRHVVYHAPLGGVYERHAMLLVSPNGVLGSVKEAKDAESQIQVLSF